MINNVKTTVDGYIVNDTLHVPSVDGNRHYKAVLLWLDEGNIPEQQYSTDEMIYKLSIEARTVRDVLLKEADLLINRVVDIGGNTIPLGTYRNELLNVPQQEGFPETIIWPELP